jgi:hypothetical protein
MELSYHSTEETFGVLYEDRYLLVSFKFLDPDYYRESPNVFVRVREIFPGETGEQVDIKDEEFINNITQEIVKEFPYKFEHKVNKPGFFNKAMDWVINGPRSN